MNKTEQTKNEQTETVTQNTDAATQKPLISIIVPVYNAGKYLRPCIESLQNQHLKELEIMLLDDGSKDASGKVCDEYAAKDKRIRVIHKSNSGLSDTRNLGIKEASADIVGFVDSDDWVDPDMFGKLYSLMTENDADIAVCEFYNSYKNKEKVYACSGKVSVYDRDEALNRIIDDDEIKSYVCNKIFRKTVISDPMPVSFSYEDYCTVFKWFAHARRVVHAEIPLYHYRQRMGSIVHDNDPQKDYHFFLAECERRQYLAENGLLRNRANEFDAKIVKIGVRCIKDIARKKCGDSVSRPFVDKIMEKMKDFLPVKMSEIGLKPYLRLQLLLFSYRGFKAAMKFGGLFANSHKLKNRELYE